MTWKLLLQLVIFTVIVQAGLIPENLCIASTVKQKSAKTTATDPQKTAIKENVLPDLIITSIKLDNTCKVRIGLQNSGKGGLSRTDLNQLAIGLQAGSKSETIPLAAYDKKETLRKPGGRLIISIDLLIREQQVLNARIDSTDAISESNEKNNTKRVKLTPKCSQAAQSVKNAEQLTVASPQRKNNSQKAFKSTGNIAANVTVTQSPSLPPEIKISSIHLSNDSVMVNIKCLGKNPVPLPMAQKLRLLVEAGKTRRMWTIAQIDPMLRMLNTEGAEKTFDTGIKITKPTKVRARIRGSRTEQVVTEILTPKELPANKQIYTTTTVINDTINTDRHPTVKEQPGLTMSAAPPTGTSQKTIMSSGVIDRLVSAGNTDKPALVLKNSDEVWGTFFFHLPRPGEIHIQGESIKVHWTVSGESTVVTGNWVIHLNKGDDSSARHQLLTWTGATGNSVDVDLPRGLSNGDDYYISVTKTDAEDERWGRSRFFSIGPPGEGGPEGGLEPGEKDVRVLRPSEGTTFIEHTLQELRWKALPSSLPVPDHIRIYWIAQDEEGQDSSQSFPGTFSLLHFDPVSRVYSLTRRITQTPGSYLLRIEHRYSEVEGSYLEGNFSSVDIPVTVAPGPPAGEGLHLLEPHSGIAIHAGETIPVRWNIENDYLDAYGPPETTIIILKTDDGPYGGDILSRREIDPALRSFDFPVPDGIEPRDCIIEIIVILGMEYGLNPRRSGSFEIIEPEGLFFTWPLHSTEVTYGHMYPITWYSRGDATHRNLDIFLLQGGSIAHTLATGIPATAGIIEWDLALNNTSSYLPEGPYNIMLRSTGSDPFTVESLQINVLFPALLFNRGEPYSGQVFRRGEERQVLWNSEHLPSGTTLTIYLDGLPGGSTVLARNVPTEIGYHTWRAGNLPGSSISIPMSNVRYRLVLDQCHVVSGTSEVFHVE